MEALPHENKIYREGIYPPTLWAPFLIETLVNKIHRKTPYSAYCQPLFLPVPFKTIKEKKETEKN